jgi:hypothetical protein
MAERIKYRPIETNSVESQSTDGSVKINLDSNSNLFPFGDINRIVDVGDQFDKERQASTHYRILGTLNTLFCNPLFNVTGQNSWSSFMDAKFRDGSFPPNGIDLGEDEDLTYSESIKEHLIEKDGWFGYIDPDLTSPTNCTQFDMVPTRNDFRFTRTDGVKNWELTLTYPSFSASTAGDITFGGLLIVDSVSVNVGGKDMVAFATPVKHGLSQGSKVNISGLSLPSLDKQYTVTRRGLDNGDSKEYYFVVDIDPTLVSLTSNVRMKRVVSGQESVYYFRVFEKLSTTENIVLDDNDYEIYQAAFSKGLYNDKIYQFGFNADINVGGVKDNLNRPLSEIYLTLVKTPTERTVNIANTNINISLFTNISSGIEVPFISSVSNYINVPDIRRIHNGGSVPVQTHTPIENDVKIGDTQFYGDVVEYNKFEVKETILGEVRHRFNTKNREAGGSVVDPINTGSTVDLGIRQEGYFYKPHHLIKIRDFSGYIEQGDDSTVGIPDYAEDLGDGRFLWRDLLDIGFNDTQQEALDYPFLNGCHYIHQIYCVGVRRQDPFIKYGLYHINFPRDVYGVKMTDNFETKRVEDVC